MKSFRLYLGERKYLTGAGWAALGLAVATTCVVGYYGAAPLTDAVGPGWVSRIVAGTGLVAWGLAMLAFKLVGIPLIAELPADEPPVGG